MSKYSSFKSCDKQIFEEEMLDLLSVIMIKKNKKEDLQAINSLFIGC